MNIGYRPLHGPGFTSLKPTKINNKTNYIDNRQQLSTILFGETNIHSSNISFGWSKGINAEQEEILDLLINPKTKNVMVGCHLNPDADATGSAIGIAGILKKFGARVIPVLDDKVPTNLRQLPTNDRAFRQSNFFKTSMQARNFIKYNCDYELDVAVLTDCALPRNISNDMLMIASTAKKIVIIDHHCGNSVSEHYEKWLEKITKLNPDFEEENLLYWCDSDRSSASEMVAELDKEISDEVIKSADKQLQLNKRYSQRTMSTYRYSVAAGILDDSGARLNRLDEIPKFPRTSKKIVELENGDKVSSTEAYYRWLINNAGAKRVNLSQVNNNEKNAKINNEIRRIINGQSTLENLSIKVPEKNSKYGVLDLTDTKPLEKLLNSYESSAKSAYDVSHLFKLRALDKINNKESDLYVIATKSLETGQTVIGAYSVDNLAKMVINKLIESDLGEGGGHDCACVIRLNPGIELNDHIRTLVDEVVQNHVKSNNPESPSNTLRLLSEIIDSQYLIMRKVSEHVLQGTDSVLKPWTNSFFPKTDN